MNPAQYPSALWIPAHRSNFTRAQRDVVSLIVLHATDGQPRAAASAESIQQPDQKRSFHFVVGQDGEVAQAVRMEDIAWHAHAANRLSIGVEHCCRTPGELYKGDPGLPPSVVQLASGAKLVAWLCQFYGIEPSRHTIVGHGEIDVQTTHRTCPTGAGINLDDYVSRVVAVYTEMLT